jgi:hypothetical protein
MNSERKPGVRLPHDEAYWEGLAERSIQAAFTAPRKPASPWWHALSDASFVLAASAVLALLGGPLLVGERQAPTTPPGGVRVLATTLAPEDPMLTSLLLSRAGPPPPAVLLRLIALREERR